MELSIICPVYNGATSIGKTIKSVQQQYFTDWEMIVINDGSTDETELVCKNFAEKDSRIRYIAQNNKGVSAARNIGLLVAKGKYICFIDGDDATKHKQYQCLVTAIEASGCDIVLGGYDKVSSNGDCQSVTLPYAGTMSGDGVKKIMYSMAYWNACFNEGTLPMLFGSVWSNIYSAEIIRKYFIRFPEDLKIGEDLVFNLHYLCHVFSAAIVPEPLYEYNVGNSSATRKQNIDLWEHYKKLNQTVTEIMKEHFGESDEICYNNHRQTLNYAINVLEEQACVFLQGKDLEKNINSLCSDVYIQKAAEYLILHGKTIKDRVQAFVIRHRMKLFITMWLKKR